MSHQAAHMAMVESRTKRLHKWVRRIDDAGDVFEHNFSICFPFLNGEMLDVYMPWMRCRATSVDHKNGGGIVLMESHWSILRISQLWEDGAEILCNLGGMDSSNELSFSGTCGDRRLNFGFVGNGPTAKHEYQTRDRATDDEVSCMSSVDISSEKGWLVGLREWWQRRIGW